MFNLSWRGASNRSVRPARSTFEAIWFASFGAMVDLHLATVLPSNSGYVNQGTNPLGQPSSTLSISSEQRIRRRTLLAIRQIVRSLVMSSRLSMLHPSNRA
jgi:hypothetical protein